MGLSRSLALQARDRSQWQRDIAAVAQRPNVVGKVSGIVASAPPGKWTADDLAPIIKHTLSVSQPREVEMRTPAYQEC